MRAAVDCQNLLSEIAPHRVLCNDADYQQALESVDRLSCLLEEKPSAELEDMIELLATLIEKYEQETLELPQAGPTQILMHLMESRGMNQRQLADALELSTAHVSNILSGTRPITIELSRKLGKHFSTAPSLFLGIK